MTASFSVMGWVRNHLKLQERACFYVNLAISHCVSDLALLVFAGNDANGVCGLRHMVSTNLHCQYMDAWESIYSIRFRPAFFVELNRAAFRESDRLSWLYLSPNEIRVLDSLMENIACVCLESELRRMRYPWYVLPEKSDVPAKLDCIDCLNGNCNFIYYNACHSVLIADDEVCDEGENRVQWPGADRLMEMVSTSDSRPSYTFGEFCRVFMPAEPEPRPISKCNFNPQDVMVLDESSDESD